MYTVSLAERVGHTLRAHWQTRKGMCGEIQNLVVKEQRGSVARFARGGRLEEAVVAAFTYLKDGHWGKGLTCLVFSGWAQAVSVTRSYRLVGFG